MQAKHTLEVNDDAGVRINKSFLSIVGQAGGFENMDFVERDARNYIGQHRRSLCKDGDGQALLHFSSMKDLNNEFFYDIQLNEGNIICSVFWADARSRAACEDFGDVVCMGNKAPHGIITDQCRAMTNAIEEVFIYTKHMWCLWHIMKKLPEKFQGYKNYVAIKSDLKELVYECGCSTDFENGWEQLLTKHGLEDNEWLCNLHEERQKWVACESEAAFNDLEKELHFLAKNFGSNSSMTNNIISEGGELRYDNPVNAIVPDTSGCNGDVVVHNPETRTIHVRQSQEVIEFGSQPYQVSQLSEVLSSRFMSLLSAVHNNLDNNLL
ncbi:protein FAR-RED IMPAIRED RESPONSE 1-like [Vigna angularis]|uniref:protein FAR-RED IMPAIRED RESPONSE 1-like n=1 Tax=Phaseolus angularis TaxID=3914 RepID=UPI0022B46BBE|nr:protein FAR-RED IMPAIRED RESPONSE 1-like [Vigna angularis]